MEEEDDKQEEEEEEEEECTSELDYWCMLNLRYINLLIYLEDDVSGVDHLPEVLCLIREANLNN